MKTWLAFWYGIFKNNPIFRLVLGLCPTVYTTVRVFFLGQLPGDWSFSIAGQLSWVNLLYEVVSEAILRAVANAESAYGHPAASDLDL